MRTRDSPSGPVEDWLQSFVVDAVRRHLCTKIMCTTCGAMEFRTGLALSLAQATGETVASELDLRQGRALARGLASLRPLADRSWELEQAVRLILFETWRSVDASTFERELEPLLAGTWAGDVLTGMKAHERVRQDARQRHAQNQIRQQQERAERLRLKQEMHIERLERKKERDRLWRARNTASNS